MMGKSGAGLSNISTALFDLDGTLMDSNELIDDTWRYTVKTLTGRDISDEDVRLTLGEILADSMRRLIPDVDVEEALVVYRAYQRDFFIDRIRLFDGAEDVLRALRAAGFRTGLVTSRLKNSTERALAHFGIGGLFDAVLTASDTEAFKPDPTPILVILDRLGGRPEEAVYFGDTVHDIEAGLAAGVFTALVDWSAALPPGMRAGCAAPDAVIGSMRDIPALLGIDSWNDGII